MPFPRLPDQPSGSATASIANHFPAPVLHQNARETIQLAEERFLPRRAAPAVPFEFDNAWQEMLNHATMKLLEAERLKTSSENEHLRRANNFADAQKKVS